MDSKYFITKLSHDNIHSLEQLFPGRKEDTATICSGFRDRRLFLVKFVHHRMKCKSINVLSLENGYQIASLK